MGGLLTCSAHHCQKIEDRFLLACSSCKGDTMEQCSFLLVPHFGECALFVPVIWLFVHMTILDPNNLICDVSLTAPFVPTCGHEVPLLCSYLLHHYKFGECLYKNFSE